MFATTLSRVTPVVVVRQAIRNRSACETRSRQVERNKGNNRPSLARAVRTRTASGFYFASFWNVEGRFFTRCHLFGIRRTGCTPRWMAANGSATHPHAAFQNSWSSSRPIARQIRCWRSRRASLSVFLRIQYWDPAVAKIGDERYAAIKQHFFSVRIIRIHRHLTPLNGA